MSDVFSVLCTVVAVVLGLFLALVLMCMAVMGIMLHDRSQHDPELDRMHREAVRVSVVDLEDEL